ncbi:MAG: c-type cytochrome [Betaproteobacteria bacterium]|nr:c-type cytochrome [Betaproteobacteria bacterium]
MFALGVAATVIVALAIAGGLAYSGSISVAADEPHHPMLMRLISTARERAVERHARFVVVPNDLTDADRIRRGAGNYDAMCAGCHLEPGESDTEIRKGLYPVPPDLTRAMDDDHEGADDSGVPHVAEHFWVIKHGIKASAMAAWSRGGMTDDDIWNLVAFIQALPEMDRTKYDAVVASSGGHSHGTTGAHHHDEEPGHGHDHDAHDEAPSR